MIHTEKLPPDVFNRFVIDLASFTATCDLIATRGDGIARLTSPALDSIRAMLAQRIEEDGYTWYNLRRIWINALAILADELRTVR